MPAVKNVVAGFYLSSASCGWFNRAAVLFQGRFGSCWLLEQPMYTAERVRQRSGICDHHYGNLLSRQPPRTPGEQNDETVVSAVAVQWRAKALAVLFDYGRAHHLPSCRDSIHHHSREHGLSMRYFVFYLKGNKAKSSNDHIHCCSIQGQS